MDSASKSVIVDGVEYVPYVAPETPEPPVASEIAPVSVPAVEVEPWYSFIKASRFWIMILGALSVYLEAKGLIGEPERNLIATISTVFVAVKTLDKGASKLGGK